jgi:hypothetical protein
MNNLISASVVILAVLWNALWAFAQIGGSGGQAPPLSEREVKTLIDRLVSPNPEPKEDQGLIPGRQLPPDVVRDKQKPMREARLKLKALGKEAFPFLIERWADKRYCLTVPDAMFPGCYHNLTVGEVCRRLVYDQVQPYGHKQVISPNPVALLRPMYPSLSSTEQAKQWWERNKGKTLHAVQLEVLDWLIAEEAKEPRNFSDMERHELREIRRKLVPGGKPLPSGDYYSDEGALQRESAGVLKSPLSEHEIKTLIDGLVSPHPKPQEGLPPDFDKDKQKAVRDAVCAACSKLNALGKEAFPYLIERWEDKRYCLTVSHAPFPGCYHNLTVGEVCQRLIFNHVQPYHDTQITNPSPLAIVDWHPVAKPRPAYRVVFLSSQEQARQWWEKNKGKGLYDIQLEVLDWIIAEEAKQPGKVSDMERKELQEIRRKLVSGGKPLPSGVYFSDE